MLQSWLGLTAVLSQVDRRIVLTLQVFKEERAWHTAGHQTIRSQICDVPLPRIAARYLEQDDE